MNNRDKFTRRIQIWNEGIEQWNKMKYLVIWITEVR